jgi:hypothetical protein
VITQDNNNSDIKFLYDDSLTQKFEKMDISAELRVSVLAGLFTLEGSGKYLSSKRTSNRAVHATMRYNITTQVDRLNLFNDALKECISHDALGHDATHVVVEIQWGANSLLTLKDENRDNEDKTDIEGLLAASLKKALIQISGKADVSYSDGNLDSARSFSFEVLGDLLPKATEKMPAAIDEAVTLMKNLPSLVSSANGGKGKQLKYVLFPISAQSFRNHLATSEIAHAVLRTLEQSSIARCVNLFGEILKFSQEVNDYVQDVKEITRKCACIRREVKDQLESLEREIVVGETRLKGELASTLKDVRSGTKDTSAIDKLREDYMAGESCASKLRSKCEELYKSVGAKIEFAKMCLKLGVKYVTNGSAAENVTVENDHVVIFYASEKSREGHRTLEQK